MRKKLSLLMFIKAQLSAFTGGIVDYAVMIALTEFLHIHYTLSILISGCVGAVVNFSINRRWTYLAHASHDSPVKSQLIRFVLVVLGSVFLKSFGTYLFTNFFKIDYKIGRIITDIIVSLGFNYVLQTYWVFKRKKV